jgi:EAL domain-containing protein (putative c-di-GMP-specific phosphodiesterase class I)
MKSQEISEMDVGELLHNPEILQALEIERTAEGVDNEFSSLVSHELRTPLTSIRGAIGLVLSGKIGTISPQVERMLEIALNNTDRLMKLTNIIESSPEAQGKILTPEDLERLRLGNDLQLAITNQELELQYQPIINLGTSKIQGFEALVRWRNHRLGCVSPCDFIPIAEETGLINALGIWVLQKACQQLHQWQQEFPRDNALSMSVNVSGYQLADPEFLSQVREVLRTIPVVPTSLRLEITESVLMENQATALHTLNQLKKMGIKLYIDDFGTGYSSLSRLHEMPLDVLKIDQSFIRQQKWDLVYTLMLLAHSQKLEVIVEGIETEFQWDNLVKLGCTQGQGYFFARPLDSPVAAQLLQDELSK